MKRSIALALLGASLSASMAQTPENLDLIYSTDSSFIFASQIPLDWDGAMAFAESLGGHLATFHDVNENNAVQAELSSFNTMSMWSYWFGLVQDTDGAEPNGGWQWATGEPLNFQNWNPDATNEYEGLTGEPNNVGGSEDCGEYRFDGTWNDNPCTDARFFLVELLANLGCTDESACNFDAVANLDDGSCVSCDFVASFCGVGTIWDAESQTCIGDGSGDINLDGCVQLNDLLDLLSAYGRCWDCGGDCILANATSACVNGECVITGCNGGFADYNGEALDGCEGEEVPPWSCGEDLVFEGHAYATVQINGQCWFAENLRSTSYANGDAISGDLTDAAWSTTSGGGRATFGEGASVCYGPAPSGDACNEAFSLSLFGRLYNWHAVNDARGICPSGWHVPSDGEWTSLTDGIGGALTAGNTLKAGSEWFNSGNGTSSNGFDAFPGGQRMNAGNFQGAGTDAFFWTSTALTSVQVWFRSMGWNLPEVVRNPAEKNVGMSIRCLQDAE